MKNFSPVGLNINLPWITKFLEVFNIGGYKHFAHVLRDFEDIFKREVEERLRSKDALTRDDFIGCYLQEMENRNNDSKPHTFTIENLLGNLVILFIAGNESTYAGVIWLLLLMTTYEDVQEKVHQEIDAVIGKDGTVCFDDKIKTPYTLATIMEMARFISINPIYPPRYPLATFTFHGYTIPQGSHILCNIWSIMHNPKYFEKPMEFKPERFLTDDGLKVLKPTGYAPFSFGKRNCPGEVVAIMTIYLYFVSIMQKFKVKTPHGLPADFDYIFGGALLPRPQKLCFIER
ncbi:cytochrome P450 2U1-like [Stegodyphus dumicola]|uniref:cytochrome P450 2U1-like n=1 Tax=Stegodyphus dumicola TaxID=202533 RepID=UPI0015A9F868|nr:cytochrome P450 2U1-like [Stegodyphus dumicola]